MNALSLLTRYGSSRPATEGSYSELIPAPSTDYPAATAGNTGMVALDGYPNASNYGSIGYASNLNPTGEITVEWRGIINSDPQVNSTGVNQTLVELPWSSHADPYYAFGLYVAISGPVAGWKGLARFDLTIAGARSSINARDLPEVQVGVPLHLAGTYDGTTQRLYVNGRLVVSKAITGSISTINRPIYVGRHGNVTFEGADAWHDELRIWSVARTRQQIVNAMSQQLDGTETGLEGLWLFNEGSGASFADATANDNDGSITGSYLWGANTSTWDGTNNETHLWPVRLNLDTPDETGETTDPSVVYVPGGIGGHAWWMAVTPYADSSSDVENPCIFASDDGIEWVEPVGVTNPIFEPTGTGFYSDTALLAVNANGTPELWLYWREADPTAGTIKLLLSRSSDGVTWSSPVTVLTYSIVTGSWELLSPTVWHDGTQFVMIYTAYPDLKRRTSADGVTWSAAADVTVTGMPSGRSCWHVDAERTSDGTVHFLFDTATSNTGAEALQYYASSSDGGQTIAIGGALGTPASTQSQQYAGSLVHDPTYVDRWWVFYGVMYKDPYDQLWASVMERRRLVSGSWYQENAGPL